MNMKRMRGRNHRPGGGGGGPIRHHNGNIPLNRNHVFDSSGPDLRVRGTAQQLFEKYLQLGRDATSSGDRVSAEGYFQHAEHYFRILNAIAQAQQNQQNQHGGAPNRDPAQQGVQNNAGHNPGQNGSNGGSNNGQHRFRRGDDGYRDGEGGRDDENRSDEAVVERPQHDQRRDSAPPEDADWRQADAPAEA